MNRWEEIYNNHAIHATIVWVKECVTTEFDNLDDLEVTEKRRFLKIISKYEDVLSKIDPELIPVNQLDAINNGLRQQQLAAQLNAYKTSGNVANLNAANNLLTNQITSLAIFISLNTSVVSATEATNLEKLIDTSTKTLIDRKNSILEDYKTLENNIQEKQNTLESLSTQVEKKKSEINSLGAEWQNQFSTSQESRSEGFNKWRDEFTNTKNDEIEKVILANKEKFDTETKQFNENIDNILTDSKAKHESILELYGLVAGDSVASGYMSNADDEMKQANKWRLTSIGFIIATVFWMLFAYYSNAQTDIAQLNIDKLEISNVIKSIPELQVLIDKNNNFPWFKLFITFSLSGILLWGSAYSAQQSTRHRNNEKRTRWFALEVKAIDPFINSLALEQKNELKKQLSERLFGQFAHSKDDNTKVIDEHVFKLVADTLGGILSKIPSK